MPDDRYSGDPIARMREQRRPKPARKVPISGDLWLEEATTGFYGRLVRADRRDIVLRDVDGMSRTFPLDCLYLLDDEPVRLGPPERRAPEGRARSRSGSFHVADAPARVAREGRIFVEGRHDAELVEQVWGHDLRVDGVVVEYLEGADHLDEVLDAFGPTSGRRVGVLLDHLVPGSKEQRIADQAVAGRPPGSLLIVGHPYIDIWQGVKPARIGREAWPVIPKGQSWKHGVCRELGWPAEDQADIARAWKRILERVRDYRDLEPALIGRVEELIDFVTAPEGGAA